MVLRVVERGPTYGGRRPAWADLTVEDADGHPLPPHRDSPGSLLRRLDPRDVVLPAPSAWTTARARVLSELLVAAVDRGTRVTVGDDTFDPRVRLDRRLLSLVAELLATSDTTGGQNGDAVSGVPQTHSATLQRPDGGRPPSSTSRSRPSSSSDSVPEPGTNTRRRGHRQRRLVIVADQSQLDPDAPGAQKPGDDLGRNPRRRIGAGQRDAASAGIAPRRGGAIDPAGPLPAGELPPVQGKIPGMGVRGGT